MSKHEILTATFITPPARWCVALATDEFNQSYYHVCELADDGLYYSFYLAASYEDALDVLSIYLDVF